MIQKKPIQVKYMEINNSSGPSTDYQIDMENALLISLRTEAEKHQGSELVQLFYFNFLLSLINRLYDLYCNLDGEDSLLLTPINGKKGRVESEDPTTVSKAGTAQQEDDGVNDDKVEEYWSSDHHKFEWSGYMQSLNPRSWHALGLGVPESFLSKGWYCAI